MSDLAVFSIRIFTVDYYMSKPVPKLDVCYSPFRKACVKRVPVLRIFGPTPAGQKTCLHIHGVFPYLYVPYDGSQPVDNYLREFANSIDKAVNASIGESAGTSSATLWHQQTVFKISLVSGVPIYGYNPIPMPFLKIYIYNPNLVGKIADLLLAGAVMNKIFQPHEAHLPFTLQFFIDYNLYGMNWINLNAVKFRTMDNQRDTMFSDTSDLLVLDRSSLPSSTLQPYRVPGEKIWNDQTIPECNCLPELERTSCCEVEIDAVAADIMNRQDLTNQVGINPGIRAIWEDERQRRRNRDELSQLLQEPSQERENPVILETEQHFIEQIDKIITRYDESLQKENANGKDQSLQLNANLISAFGNDIHTIQSDIEDNDNYQISENRSVEGKELKTNLNETMDLYDDDDSVDPDLVQLVAGLADDISNSQIGGAIPDDGEVSVLYGSGPGIDSCNDKLKLEREELEESFEMSQAWNCKSSTIENLNDSLSSQNILFSSPEVGSTDANHILQIDGEDDSSTTDSLDDITDNLSSTNHSVEHKTAYITPEVKSSKRMSTFDQSTDTVSAGDRQIKSSSSPHRLQHSEFDSKVNRKRKLQPIVAVAQVITDKCHTKSPVTLLPHKSDQVNHPDEGKILTSKIKSVPVLKFNDLIKDKDSKTDIFGKNFDSQMRNEMVDGGVMQTKRVHGQLESPSKKLKSYMVSEKTTTGQEFSFDEQMRRDFCVGNVAATVRDKKSLRDGNRTLMHYFSNTIKGMEDRKSVTGNNNNDGALYQSANTEDDINSLKDIKFSASKVAAMPSSLNDNAKSIQSPTDTIHWSSFDSGSIAFPVDGDRTSSNDVMMNLSFPSPVDSSTNISTPPLAQSPNQTGDHYDDEEAERKLLEIKNESYNVKDRLDSCNYIEPLCSFDSVHEDNTGHDTTLDSSIQPILTSSVEEKKYSLQYDNTLGTEIDITNRRFCYGLPVNQSGIWRPMFDPPTKETVASTFLPTGILGAKYVEPYCSEAADIPRRPKEIQGRFLRVKSDKTSELQKFESGNNAFRISGLSHWQLILSNSIHPYLRHFMKSTQNDPAYERRIPREILPVMRSLRGATITLTPCSIPPSRYSVGKWLKRRWNPCNAKVESDSTVDTSGLSSSTEFPISFPDDARKLQRVRGLDTHDCDLHVQSSFHNPKDGKASREVEHLTTLSLELHIETRIDLCPDPEFDPILGIFYHLHRDIPDGTALRNEIIGMILVDSELRKGSSMQEENELSAVDVPFTSTQKSTMVDNSPLFSEIGCGKDNNWMACKSSMHKNLLAGCGITDMITEYVPDEISLMRALVRLIKRWDPDILVGYEIQMLSWGYILQRGKNLQIDLATLLSRIPSRNNKFQFELEDDFQANYKTDAFIVGRVIVNIWRIMRYEVALRSYTFENVMDHVLHHRYALHTFQSLTNWFQDDKNRWRTVHYYVVRCRGNWQLLEKFDMIDRSSEFARLYGIQFYSVLSRGSQFRVESMLLRLAKPMNYIPVSVSEKQRAWMKAPEVIPLVMEPESRFYSNPVLVLDFQSLYPSVMIAYNYCFSTCLGRVSGIASGKEFKFGCTSHQVPVSLLKKLRNDISVAPCGAVYVQNHIRKGVMPSMLKEILDTRVMIKQAMKKYKDNKSLQRLLDIRQFGLKMIANVTYGYAAATFCGRMPLIELADSIVSKARETLERAIKIVNTTSKWNARVVYGDTDSMFVLLEGATKDRAFAIGREIAETITAINPKPITLKFEKIFLPSLLITKKRYVGFAYESSDQKEPIFDAKGIETVRRDGCPAVSKIMEKAIRIFFSRCDMSLVKKYVLHQCRMLIEGTVAVNDYVIAKEYRGKSTYKPGACVPALEITKQVLAYDRRAEPRVGERVPYVIVYGVPGVPLIRLVRRPCELLNNPNLRLNATYYITKQILPALDRLFSLIGINVEGWYTELPRSIRSEVISQTQIQTAKQGIISQYFSSLHCLICEEMTVDGVCPSCLKSPQKAVVVAQQRIAKIERKNRHLNEICCNCIGQQIAKVDCISLDCPILFKTKQSQRDIDLIPRLRNFITKISTIVWCPSAEDGMLQS